MNETDRKTVIKLKKLILNCQSFYNAAQLLWLDYNKEKLAEKINPFVVNASFASELALKALLAKCKCGFIKGHKIYELYLQLPQEARDCIMISLKNFYPEQEMAWLLNQIKLVSDYFYKVRYIYDFTMIIDVTFCKNLMESFYLLKQKFCGEIDLKVKKSLTEEDIRQFDDKFLLTYYEMIKEADDNANKLMSKVK